MGLGKHGCVCMGGGGGAGGGVNSEWVSCFLNLVVGFVWERRFG